MTGKWFYRKSSIKKLWTFLLILLLLLVMSEFLVKLHPHFKVESIFGFHAAYGFISCVVIVLLSKVLGFLVKRKDDYYDM